MAGICSHPTKAVRRYVQRMRAWAFVYLGTVWVMTRYVHQHHLTGAKLFMLAAIPAVEVVGMIAIVGIYLRDEVDEFKRHQLIVSILWAIGFTLALMAFMDFLQSYQAITAPPPFMEFIVFWLSMALMQSIQKFRNRVRGDE
ncbi:MAG TPA: hypothetical protein VN734_06580 [Acidobacteriaceae bacterium]|nr:hypothetical protein [Acidobacteriaceae bacterium]